MKRLAIFTAIFGKRDKLIEPPSGDFDFIFFTDDPPPTTRAIVKLCPMPVKNDPIRSARMIKTLSHIFLPEYEYTAWIDGCYVLKADIVSYVKERLQFFDIAAFQHPWRKCIYKEAAEVIRLELDNPEVVLKQMYEYRQNKFPENYGLAATGVILRKNLSPKVIEFNLRWWKEISSHSRRDQLSFNYVAWKLGIRYEELVGYIYESKYFKHMGHQLPLPS